MTDIQTTNASNDEKLNSSIKDFVEHNDSYYAIEFNKIQSATKFPWAWNTMAALTGPFWAAGRGLWGQFWTFMILELLALVQLGRGLWGDLGADKIARVERLTKRSNELYEKAKAALEAGDESAQGLIKTAENLKTAAERVSGEAAAAAAQATGILITGIVLIIAIKILQGFYANIRYEKQYLSWRAEPDLTPNGFKWSRIGYGIVLWLAVIPLTMYRFTFTKPVEWIKTVPIGKEFFTPVSSWLDNGFDWLSLHGSGAFNNIVEVIRSILDGLETVFVDTPWPVVMMVILVTAWRLAGARVAIFTAMCLAYLALFGLWETSMQTVALLGAAAFICIVLGIPLGIWFGKSQRTYNAALPILDFMQTMPAFVYLIPIIAFFGTGKPPGVLSTIIFGMPPVIRLTALGIKGVPEHTKEAAIAFGCTKFTLLKDVEIPLAMPSIMTGINQTILMCLSMVVIASLIGAGGLGKNVLEALQYAAKGQGMLAGIAILFCAMVIDRIVQGHYNRKTKRH